MHGCNVYLLRAVCGRIENSIEGLPPPYRLNKPLLSLTSSREARQPTKAPSYSLNWTFGEENICMYNSKLLEWFISCHSFSICFQVNPQQK